jgi:hypothetical protein
LGPKKKGFGGREGKMSHQDWEPVVLKKKTAAKPKSTEDAVTQGARSGGGVALQTKHGAGK